MKLKFPILLWIAMQSALPGQDAGELMRKGEDALTAGLWEMAALHFNDCLSSKKLDPKVKSDVAIRLAEAWVRDGKPKEALELLEQSFVSAHPEAPFWKGQALSGLGRFAEAVASFGPIVANPAAPLRIEAGFSSANLQMALGLADEALHSLSSLSDIPDPHQASKIRLHQVEILLDLERFSDARGMMPPADQVAAATHLIETSPEPARPAAVRQASTFWVESAPAACRDWLDALPPDLRAAGAAPFTSARAAAELNPTLDWLEQFPPAIRHGCLVHAFDAWTAAHPGAGPDTSAWSEERRQAWDDLQALKSIGTP